MSYNWKGRTVPFREKVGNIEIITKTIHFNFRYALQLMGVDTGEMYSFKYFVNTMAHEIAHCLLIDYDPKYLYESSDHHNQWHKAITASLMVYLCTFPEIQELTKFQKVN